MLHRYTEVELQLFLRTGECRISWQNGPSARTAACCKTHSLAHSVTHTSLSGRREYFHVTICFNLWGIGDFGQYINHYEVAESRCFLHIKMELVQFVPENVKKNTSLTIRLERPFKKSVVFFISGTFRSATFKMFWSWLYINKPNMRPKVLSTRTYFILEFFLYSYSFY